MSLVFEADCDGNIFQFAPDGHWSEGLSACAVKVDQELRYELDHPALVDPLHPEGVGEAPDPVVLHQAAISRQYWPQLGDRTLSQVHYLDPAQSKYLLILNLAATFKNIFHQNERLRGCSRKSSA